MMTKIWKLNTVAVSATMLMGVTSIIGLITAPTMLYELDDWLIIGICAIMSLWYVTGDNRWRLSLVPSVLLTVLSFITLIAFIGEAGTTSLSDELLALPILCGLTIAEYVLYFRTRNEQIACCQQA